MNTRHKVFAVLAFLGLAVAGALAQQGGGIQGGQSGGFTNTAFTLDFSPSCSANSTQNYTASVSGSVVVLTATQSIFCTSSAVTMTTAAGALPVALRPTRTIALLIVRVQDNGGGLTQPGCLQIATDGTVSIGTNVIGTSTMCSIFNGWTAAGTKGFASAYGTFTYTTL